MYLAFYGLQTKPFELLPDPRFLYVSRGHDLALTHLEYGILENKALIALTGDVGTGKTTLINYLLKKLKTEFSSAVIVNPHLDPTEFLAVVLRQFGENADDHRKSLLFDNIHRFLLDQQNHGRRSVLLIDEAQNLPLDTLEEVRMLSNLHTEDRHLIQIVLAGQPQLQRRLKDPELAQLTQRISVYYHLYPLEEADVNRYIVHRLSVAGYHRKEPLFSPDAVRRIYQYTKGVPRLINIICDTALMYGYADGAAIVDLALTEKVIRDRGIHVPGAAVSSATRDEAPAPLPEKAAASSPPVARREMSSAATPANLEPAPPPPPGPVTTVGTPPGRADSDFVFSQTSVAEPSYSQTRNVVLNRKQLIERRVFSILSKNRVADQYKLLRTVILNRTRSFGYNTIIITSFKENEGKSLTAINLSITLATESRQTVLLVDMDLRQPTVHKILGIKEGPGLKDYFLNNMPLKDILVHPDIEALTVLPAGGRMDNSTEIIGSYRTEELVLEIKSRYPDRYIIFDTPALNNCPDALVLSSYVDAIVVVARANYTSAENLSKCMGLLKDRNVVGVVLNRGDIRKEWAY